MVNSFTQLYTDESAMTPEVAETGWKSLGKLGSQSQFCGSYGEGGEYSVLCGKSGETSWLQWNSTGL